MLRKLPVSVVSGGVPPLWHVHVAWRQRRLTHASGGSVGQAPARKDFPPWEGARASWPADPLPASLLPSDDKLAFFLSAGWWRRLARRENEGCPSTSGLVSPEASADSVTIQAGRDSLVKTMTVCDIRGWEG